MKKFQSEWRQNNNNPVEVIFQVTEDEKLIGTELESMFRITGHNTLFRTLSVHDIQKHYVVPKINEYYDVVKEEGVRGKLFIVKIRCGHKKSGLILKNQAEKIIKLGLEDHVVLVNSDPHALEYIHAKYPTILLGVEYFYDSRYGMPMRHPDAQMYFHVKTTKKGEKYVKDMEQFLHTQDFCIYKDIDWKMLSSVPSNWSPRTLCTSFTESEILHSCEEKPIQRIESSNEWTCQVEKGVMVVTRDNCFAHLYEYGDNGLQYSRSEKWTDRYIAMTKLIYGNRMWPYAYIKVFSGYYNVETMEWYFIIHERNRHRNPKTKTAVFQEKPVVTLDFVQCVNEHYVHIPVFHPPFSGDDISRVECNANTATFFAQDGRMFVCDWDGQILP